MTPHPGAARAAVTTTAEAAIPDSVVNRVPFSEGSGGTASATVGSADITLNNGDKWISNASFRDGTAVEFNQTGDGPATWTPRTQAPITWAVRTRVDPDGLQTDEVGNNVFAHDANPRLFYRTDTSEWSFRDGSGSTVGSISDSGNSGDIRIVTARLDSNNAAMDVYQSDASTKVGSVSTSSPDTTFGSSTQYLYALSGGSAEFSDALDLIDVHDSYLSDSELDSVVSDVYG